MTVQSRLRARARCAHIYLTEGLTDEAAAELERLIADLGEGLVAPPEPAAAKHNGGGASRRSACQRHRAQEAGAEEDSSRAGAEARPVEPLAGGGQGG